MSKLLGTLRNMRVGQLERDGFPDGAIASCRIPPGGLGWQPEEVGDGKSTREEGGAFNPNAASDLLNSRPAMKRVPITGRGVANDGLEEMFIEHSGVGVAEDDDEADGVSTVASKPPPPDLREEADPGGGIRSELRMMRRQLRKAMAKQKDDLGKWSEFWSAEDFGTISITGLQKQNRQLQLDVDEMQRQAEALAARHRAEAEALEQRWALKAEQMVEAAKAGRPLAIGAGSLRVGGFRYVEDLDALEKCQKDLRRMPTEPLACRDLIDSTKAEVVEEVGRLRALLLSVRSLDYGVHIAVGGGSKEAEEAAQRAEVPDGTATTSPSNQDETPGGSTSGAAAAAGTSVARLAPDFADTLKALRAAVESAVGDPVAAFASVGGGMCDFTRRELRTVASWEPQHAMTLLNAAAVASCEADDGSRPVGGAAGGDAAAAPPGVSPEMALASRLWRALRHAVIAAGAGSYMKELQRGCLAMLATRWVEMGSALAAYDVGTGEADSEDARPSAEAGEIDQGGVLREHLADYVLARSRVDDAGRAGAKVGKEEGARIITEAVPALPSKPPRLPGAPWEGKAIALGVVEATPAAAFRVKGDEKRPALRRLLRRRGCGGGGAAGVAVAAALARAHETAGRRGAMRTAGASACPAEDAPAARWLLQPTDEERCYIFDAAHRLAYAEYLEAVAWSLDDPFQDTMRRLFDDDARGLAVHALPIKPRERVREQAASDHAVRRAPREAAIHDCVRCTIVCSSPSSLVAALRVLEGMRSGRDGGIIPVGRENRFFGRHAWDRAAPSASCASTPAMVVYVRFEALVDRFEARFVPLEEGDAAGDGATLAPHPQGGSVRLSLVCEVQLQLPRCYDVARTMHFYRELARSSEPLALFAFSPLWAAVRCTATAAVNEPKAVNEDWSDEEDGSEEAFGDGNGAPLRMDASVQSAAAITLRAVVLKPFAANEAKRGK